MRVVGNAMYPYCHRTGFAMQNSGLKNDPQKKFYIEFL